MAIISDTRTVLRCDHEDTRGQCRSNWATDSPTTVAVVAARQYGWAVSRLAGGWNVACLRHRSTRRAAIQ